MFDPKFIEGVAEKLSNVIPPQFGTLKNDAKKNFTAILQTTLAQMNLVTREEFEVQKAVLATTRKKVDELEKQLKEWEHKQP